MHCQGGGLIDCQRFLIFATYVCVCVYVCVWGGAPANSPFFSLPNTSAVLALKSICLCCMRTRALPGGCGGGWVGVVVVGLEKGGVGSSSHCPMRLL